MLRPKVAAVITTGSARIFCAFQAANPEAKGQFFPEKRGFLPFFVEKMRIFCVFFLRSAEKYGIIPSKGA